MSSDRFLEKLQVKKKVCLTAIHGFKSNWSFPNRHISDKLEVFRFSVNLDFNKAVKPIYVVEAGKITFSHKMSLAN
jgi:hypothetical protein